MATILCRHHECIHAEPNGISAWALCKRNKVHIRKGRVCMDYKPSKEYLEYVRRNKREDK